LSVVKDTQLESILRNAACLQSKNRLILCAFVAALATVVPACSLEQQPQPTSASAAALVKSGRYEAAASEAKRALLSHPKDPGLWTIEGIAYAMQGKDEEALTALRTALRIAPDFVRALQAEAQILYRQHDPELADVLKEILRLDPNDSTAREMLALEQARRGDCKSADIRFGQLSGQLNTHAESLERFGACLFTEGEYAESAAVFQQFQTLQPASAAARYDLALAKMRAGQKNEAAETLKPLLASPDVDTALLASDVFEDLGDTPQAVSLVRRAIVLDPMRADSYMRFAELCMLHDSYQTGIDMVSAGIARLPHDSGLYLARGLLYGAIAQYDKAEADFRAAEQLDPTHGTGSYGVGLVQEQSDHPGEASATTRAALRDHPQDAQLNFLLARLLIEGGAAPGSPEFAEASHAAETAVRLKPDLLSAHDLLAKIDDMQGETAGVIEQSREALRIDPSDQAAMYRLMRAVRKTGDAATAQALLKQVADQHERAREEETQRLHYKIVEATAPEPQRPTQP
jgi:tetratricopeptide (TPR) repeat protein